MTSNGGIGSVIFFILTVAAAIIIANALAPFAANLLLAAAVTFVIWVVLTRLVFG